MPRNSEWIDGLRETVKELAFQYESRQLFRRGGRSHENYDNERFFDRINTKTDALTTFVANVLGEGVGHALIEDAWDAGMTQAREGIEERINQQERIAAMNAEVAETGAARTTGLSQWIDTLEPRDTPLLTAIRPQPLDQRMMQWGQNNGETAHRGEAPADQVAADQGPPERDTRDRMPLLWDGVRSRIEEHQAAALARNEAVQDGHEPVEPPVAGVRGGGGEDGPDVRGLLQAAEEGGASAARGDGVVAAPPTAEDFRRVLDAIDDSYAATFGRERRPARVTWEMGTSNG